MELPFIWLANYLPQVRTIHTKTTQLIVVQIGKRTLTVMKAPGYLSAEWGTL